MIKTHPQFMIHKDKTFADECIDQSLSYGTVEELIKGRISSLYVLPLVLNALTSSDSHFMITQQNDHLDHIRFIMYIFKKRYSDTPCLTYFITYLYRIIAMQHNYLRFIKMIRTRILIV